MVDASKLLQRMPLINIKLHCASSQTVVKQIHIKWLHEMTDLLTYFFDPGKWSQKAGPSGILL